MDNKKILFIAAMIFFTIFKLADLNAADWAIDTDADWKKAKATATNITLKDGFIEPTKTEASFESVIKKFDKKQKAKSITFKQSPAWNNWKSVPSVGPKNTRNAPIFLPVGDKDYWYFAAGGKNVKGQKGPKGGYHAWHSTDMKTWTHHGPVAPNWMTTAEYADGKFYLYYDKPNDEDPHLVIAELPDGKKEDKGMVFKDPSHGSDCAVFRDDDGTFHIIYEDWDPINARNHAWDSPLAGHSDSPDGITGFKPHEHPAPIDERTKPTGKFGTYLHPNSKQPQRYEIHEGKQNAYGDYTMIKVGNQYYIFCDYHAHDQSMRVGRWTSDNLYKQFTWAGEVGENFHPDPTVGFAEGQFYLIVQRAKEDFISPGPWVEEVQIRVGVDTTGNGKIDQWTGWQKIRESYKHKPGFARIVDTTPANLDLSSLPAGTAFKFEFKTKDRTENKSKPIIDKITLTFE